MITGESGTGKTLLAKTIHLSSNRKDGPFNSINCAAIPSDLLESELFGYKKGAFTGADRDKKGIFEISDKGTLLLDEIGEMDINLQTKLLKVIQEKKVKPLGSNKEIEVDVRIITATNANLLELIKENKFREDLFYRINVLNFEIPPLRERREDIEDLASYFIKKYSDIMKKNIKKIDRSYIDTLKNLEYKGNIRELENIIESSVALCENGRLRKEDIMLSNLDFKNSNVEKGKIIPVFIGESLEVIEKRIILANYEYFNENQKITAEKLGISDRTIRNKLKTYEKEEKNS